MNMSKQSEDVLPFVVDIVCAYVSNHAVAPADVPALIDTVSARLSALAGGVLPTEALTPQLTTAQIRKSVTADYIVCFENGRSYRSLTRHLRAAYGLTPEEYRAKWHLPPDYPMVAPNYAAMRSKLARSIGLGSANPGTK